MGFFDKKYCDICGNKIGMLGNYKLADGNMCKDCASQLSKWASRSKASTVEEIKSQIVGMFVGASLWLAPQRAIVSL